MIKACDLHRRQLLKGLGAATLLSQLPAFSAQGAVRRHPYIDGLSFLPDDLADVKASGLDAFICDVSDIEAIKQLDGTTNYKRTYKACMASIKQARQRVADNPQILLLGEKGTDIDAALDSQRTAVFFQIQGADCVEGDLNLVEEFHRQGLRVLQLTHHYGNEYAGGALDFDANGGLNKPLTARGRELIARLNEVNMLVDVSHSSPQTALDAVKASSAPIIQSHGAARALVKHARCSPDEVIRAIGDSGGVFGVFMMSFWLTYRNPPTLDDYIRQLEHVANVGGVEAAAIANDFPLRGQENLLKLNNDNAEGVKEYLEWWHSLAAKHVLGFEREPRHVVIPELNHIERMSRIDDALAKARFKATDRDRFMGGNWQRVLQQVLV
ncbi:dipeptidase [Shewanella sp. AS16]|uniref:membrane dipeptidase n=1 Tax=Shewanella sp. AS16 TaxID=2907625 RepID=UPI001F2FF910|nr:membrane dipeptidase [Shewanella sp. AS16]MCE9685659.1 dipeptidase [Shewanella sp. AS16]